MHPAAHVDAIIVRVISNMSILLREFILSFSDVKEVHRNKLFFRGKHRKQTIMDSSSG